MADAPRYEAFISYAHRDRAWATWLHRTLETYRVPARLVEKAGGSMLDNGRLRPLFCDREELSAAGDLTATVRAALADSGALIVICSPAAVASRWVNEEILAFKRLHGEQRVFCAIVDGDPAATGPTQSCFPDALCHSLRADGSLASEVIEPLAADFRPQGDGRRLGKLKLVAGLLNLRLDALIQREAQRRQRRLAWIASAAAVGMVLMGGLALEAMRERSEAVRQRGQAEGMVEFMIGDLRKKLEPMGRLDALDAVGDRALQYYSSQDLRALDADSLGRRARVLHLLGELHDLRGNLNAAYDEFRQAALSTEQSLRRQPDDTQRIFDHAQSVFWVGFIAWQRGNLDDAQNYFHQYESLAQRLVKADPSKRDWQMELAWSRRNLGTVDLDQNHVELAAIHFQASRAITAALVKANINDDSALREQAQSLAWMADTEARRGNWDAVIDNRVAERSIYEDLLAKDPKDQGIRQSLPVTERALATAALAQGYGMAAVAHLNTAGEYCAQLRATEPDNTFWKELSMDVAVNLAQTQLAEGHLALSDEALLRAEDWGRQLAGSDASVFNWQRLELQRRLLQAQRHFLGGDDFLATRSLAAVSEAIDAAIAHHHDNRAMVSLRMDALALSGRLAQSRHDAAAAHSTGQRLLALGSADDPEPHRQFLRAQGLELGGRTADARIVADSLWRQGYHHPELQALRQRMDAKH